MRGNKIIFITIVILTSCGIIKEGRLYSVDSGGKVLIIPNGRFKFNDGITEGDWWKSGKVFILNSDYRKDKIKEINIDYSLANSRDSVAMCVTYLRTGAYVPDASIILYSNDSWDTLHVNVDNTYVSFIKNKKYDSLSIETFDIIQTLKASSDKVGFYFNDTLNIIIDDLGSNYYYHEMDYEPFLLKKKRLYPVRDIMNKN